MKCLLIAFLLCCGSIHIQAQTLFSYGPHKVSQAEFLRAFHKNNPDTGNYRKQITEYLDLYTRFRLKVQWAYDARLDTLPAQRSDAASFRQQIESSYLTDTTVFASLAQQAWERSLKEIRLGYIFIPYRKQAAGDPLAAATYTRDDSLSAVSTARKVSDALRSGQSFEALALQYSADPQVSSNKGYLGYVTVFTLPYDMENAVYALADQELSAPVASRTGLHLFRKLGERPASGKVELAQILLAVDPASGNAGRERIQQQADSIYQLIRGGADFDTLALMFSNDKSSFATGGRIPPFGVGEYDPVFEEQAFALGSAGDVCKPFATAYGFHILKKIGAIPVERDRQAGVSLYRGLIQDDRRNQLASEAFTDAALRKSNYRRSAYAENDLWAMTDTMLLTGKEITAGSLRPASELFRFDKHPITATDWLAYVREQSDGNGRAGYPSMMKAFVRSRAVDHYRNNLERYDPAFARQMTEFRDGNLLFEAMERQVWSKAARDTAGLRAHYNRNRQKYAWGPSVDAIIVHVSTLALAEELLTAMKKQPSAWSSLQEQQEGRMVADSGRFELHQLPQAPGIVYTAGTFTPLVSNSMDGSQSFVYVIKSYPQPEPRSFEAAKGMVMTDYQQVLEDQWIAQLKRRYPVKVDPVQWQKLLQQP